MKTFNILSITLAATVVFVAMVWPYGAHAAEKHSALCLLSTESSGEQKDRFIEVDDFDSAAQCSKEMVPLTKDDNYIGEGGTNQHMKRVDWNLDCYCIQKRAD